MSTTSPDQLMPDLLLWRRALDPTVVAYAAAWTTLEQLSRIWLAQARASQPGGRSLLTPSGYPAEFTFRTGSDTLGYTAEPGLTERSPEAKWNNIRAITGIGPPISEESELLSALRSQPGQRFGCWLGVRQGVGDISYKVYQEVTPSGNELVRQHVQTQMPSLDPMPRIIPQLVGQALPFGATEYYFHVPDPRPSTLHALLKAANAADRLRISIDCLAWLVEIPASQLRERLRVGLSYRVATGQTTVATLFIHAAQIGSSNRHIRQQLLELARQLNLDFSRYDRATRSMTEWDPPIPLHGLVGLTVEPSGNVSLSIGVCPPPRQPISINCCDNRAGVASIQE